MATIQVRDIPDDVYDEIRREAAAAGQSLQSFMCQHVVQDFRSRRRRAAILEQLTRELEAHPTSVTRESIVSDLRRLRDDDER